MYTVLCLLGVLYSQSDLIVGGWCLSMHLTSKQFLLNVIWSKWSTSKVYGTSLFENPYSGTRRRVYSAPNRKEYHKQKKVFLRSKPGLTRETDITANCELIV
jgi:hypothetical protein